MLVKNILAALTFAIVASATPLAERGACGDTCTGKDVQGECSADENACCCDLVNLGVGVGCKLLDCETQSLSFPSIPT